MNGMDVMIGINVTQSTNPIYTYIRVFTRRISLPFLFHFLYRKAMYITIKARMSTKYFTFITNLLAPLCKINNAYFLDFSIDYREMKIMTFMNRRKVF